jgi:3-oxoacyl-[acyl-carrier protein] reductase
MTDYFLELAKNPWAQKIAAKLPMNMALPPVLNRKEAAWGTEELSGKYILFIHAASGSSSLSSGLAKNVEALGGSFINERPTEKKIDALVLDFGKTTDVQDTALLYAAVHSHIKSIKKSGRLIIHWQKSAKNDALEAALSALVKSIGRELGKYGSTANLVISDGKASGPATQAAIVWFISDRSAFISGQVFQIEGNSGAASFNPAQAGLLAGKTAIVTGAARGIGLLIAQYFRRESAHVIGIDHPSQEDLLRSEMKAIGADILLQDLADTNAVTAIKNFIHSGPGQIDIMVHNAGITKDRTIANMQAADWERVLQVNYTFPSKMTMELVKPGSAIIPLIKEGGRIVNISSIVGLAGNFGQTNYSAAKGALIGHTKDMHKLKFSANINAIACGFIETKMTEKIPPVMREIARRMNALKQGGLPSDVAEATVFLCSGLGNGVSGQTVRVCGLHPAGA